MNFADHFPLRPDSGGFPLNADDTHRTETFGAFAPLEIPDKHPAPYATLVRAWAESRTPLVEKDPTGRSAHAPGAKLDAGKLRPALVLGGFARALIEVSKVGTYGATKYTENGWQEVPNGAARYDDAFMRHWLKDKTGEPTDPDTEITHLAHAAWNALARLDLLLRSKETE